MGKNETRLHEATKYIKETDDDIPDDTYIIQTDQDFLLTLDKIFNNYKKIDKYYLYDFLLFPIINIGLLLG